MPAPPKPSTPPQPPRLVYLLNSGQRRLQQWLAARQQRAAGLDGAAPTPAQAGALFHLASQDGATMGELAQALDLAPPATSGLVQRMELSGWVLRCPCPDDARAQRVWLQPAGQAVLPALREALGPINRRLSAGFTADEMQTVARWLQHLQALDPDQDDDD